MTELYLLNLKSYFFFILCNEQIDPIKQFCSAAVWANKIQFVVDLDEVALIGVCASDSPPPQSPSCPG